MICAAAIEAENVRVAPSELAQKLKIEPRFRCLVLNPPDGFFSRLDPLPEGATATADGGAQADLVQLFAQNRVQLEREFPAGFKALKPGAVRWVSFPSSAAGIETDLSRNHGWGVLHAAGLTATQQSRRDAAWRGVRFEAAPRA